ncbi:putative multidrug resistance protein NorM [Frankliniella fusca]|uniref:Multidrug resistance protein NorM n=1 Tax=Frankliniella fusca TaxID=407009 RepID=A0AAE1GVL7_9NEOP|nr:putative multidrug resistance protein NorM [Frankliniella fusca]
MHTKELFGHSNRLGYVVCYFIFIIAALRDQKKLFWRPCRNAFFEVLIISRWSPK